MLVIVVSRYQIDLIIIIILINRLILMLLKNVSRSKSEYQNHLSVRFLSRDIPRSLKFSTGLFRE